jgi:hypothetical protein
MADPCSSEWESTLARLPKVDNDSNQYNERDHIPHSSHNDADHSGHNDADHSGRVVQVMNCLRPLEHWDRMFESRLRHGCVCAVLCAGSGLATG